MIKLILTSVLALHIFSCSTTPPTKEGVPTIQVDDYETQVEKNTQNAESYNGFANQLNVSATKMDTKMTEAMLKRSGQIYEWDAKTFQDERAKATTDLATKTIFFVSFYTPERNHNNLTALKPIWKIYLDVGGQRYEGKATKVKSMLADLSSLYPHHNRFSTPYRLEFSVPTAQTESQSELLTITGPNAAVKLNYK